MADDVVGKFCGEVCQYGKKGCKIIDILKDDENCPAHNFAKFLVEEILKNSKTKEGTQ